MIPAYNCATYLKDALVSVLAQDLGKERMQIEVVDDASTDVDVEALVASIGGGRVQYFRQPVNVGSLRNFETCINRSRGHLIHLLHGDDRVIAGFYDKLTHLFQEHPEAGAIFTHYASIDAAGTRIYVPPLVSTEGILQNWLSRIAEYQRIQYVSIAVRREVYEKLGSFYGTSYGEDWEMWVRIARHYPMAYTPDVLAEYRGHVDSISSGKAAAGLIIPDLMQVIARIQQHLPDEDKKRILKLSKKRYADFGVGAAYHILEQKGDWSLAQTQIKQALTMSKHPSIYFHLFKFYIKLVLVKYGINL